MNTRQQILQQFSITQPREVYKEQKKERQNNTSLQGEDVDMAQVSARPTCWEEGKPSSPSVVDFVLGPEEVTGESGIVITPRELTSRYSGITVQHVRSSRGLKLAITLQTATAAAQGQCTMITAELKPADRLREIRAREDDTERFVQYLAETKTHITPATPVRMGRMHLRGKRSQWIHDSIVIATMHQDQVVTVLLYTEGEEYLIDMDLELSPNQSQYYWSQGRWGSLRTGRGPVRMQDLPLTTLGE